MDAGAFLASGLAITLSQTALIISIVAGLLSILWTVVRLYDRARYGRQGE